MAKLAVNVQGTTRTPPRVSNSANSGPNVNHEAVKRAEIIAAGLFILLVVLHTSGKIGD